MKTTLDMMDAAGMKYSWETIYIALLSDLIEIDEIERYAVKVMESDDYEDNELINDLAWGGKRKEEIIKDMLETGLVKEANVSEKLELDKIKYSILFDIREQYGNCRERFLRKVAEAYADFGYPEDMSAFVYYMPTNDKEITTKKEGEIGMIQKFNEYLIELKNVVGR